MKINELNDYILVKYLIDEEKISHKELSEKLDEYKGKKHHLLTFPTNSKIIGSALMNCVLSVNIWAMI